MVCTLGTVLRLLLACALVASVVSTPPPAALAQPQPDVDGRFTETFNGDVGRRPIQGSHPYSGQLQWITPVTTALGIASGPQVSGMVFDRSGHLLVPTLSRRVGMLSSPINTIVALDLADGTVAWTAETIDGDPGISPITTEGVRPGCLTVAEDGLVWTLDTEPPGTTALIALNPTTGREVAGRRIPVDFGFALGCHSGLHLLPGNRAAAFEATFGSLHVFDLTTGAVAWSMTPESGYRAVDLLLTSADGRRLYILDDNDGDGPDLRLLALNVANGAVVDQVGLPGTTQPQWLGPGVAPMTTAYVDVEGGIVLTTLQGNVQLGDGHVVRVLDNGGDLSIDWQVPAFHSDAGDAFHAVPDQLLPGGADGRTVVITDTAFGDSQLLALDLDDGSTAWRMPLALPPLDSDALVDAAGNILLPGLDLDGQPWAIRSATGAPLGTGPAGLIEGIMGLGPIGPDGTLYGIGTSGGVTEVFAIAAGLPGQSALSVVPTALGDGFVTLEVRGGGAAAISSATLTRGGDVRSGEILSGSSPARARVTFDLRDAAHGEWDVAVGTASGPKALGTVTVEARDEQADITVAIHMKDVLRTGESTYPVLVTIRNNGNVDANGLPVAVEVSGVLDDASLAPPDPGAPPAVPAGAPADFSWDAVPLTTSGDGRIRFAALVPTLGPKSTLPLQFGLNLPSGWEATKGRVSARTGDCWVSNDRQAVPDSCLTGLLTTGLSGTLGPATGPVGNCLVSATTSAPSMVADFRDERWAPLAWSLWSTALTCISVRVPQLAIPASASLAMGLAASALINCLGPGASQPFTFGGAFDPNDIIGPPGAGGARYLTADEPMPYTIRFENQAAAAFPADTVVITHTLDADLDPASVVLGPLGWGGRLLDPPAGAAVWDEQVLADGMAVHVVVEQVGRELTWTLRTLNPVTGQPPEDPSAGFLPPNDSPPQGEGFVSFSVDPILLPDGAVVEAQAEIIFDSNPPIQTNVWSNTIDRVPPTATVAPTAEEFTSNEVTFALGGSDSVSGVAAWRLGVQRGLLEPVQQVASRHTEDTATLLAPRGATPHLFVQAIDGAGNVQPDPVSAMGQVADDAVQRLAGASRVETAVAISRAQHTHAGAVVVARADTYPDALAGGPLAYASQAPILLTDPTALSAATAAEIHRLGATTALVLGGEAAVGPQAAADLEAMGVTVTRIAGSSRFATAAAVAEQLGAAERVFLVEGAHADPSRGWPDALAVAPLAARLGAPILLVTRDSLPAETLDAVRTIGPERVTIVGGTAAVGDAVAAQITAAGFVVDRIAGSDRYATALAITDEATAGGVADAVQTWLATGLNYPDALAAGPAVAASGGQLLLVHGQVPAASRAVLDRIAADGAALAMALLVGGPAAISPTTEGAIRAELGDSPYDG